MSDRWFVRLAVAACVVAVLGLGWGIASCDWKMPVIECDEEEEDCDSNVRTGSSGHSRSYSHGGKY